MREANCRRLLMFFLLGTVATGCSGNAGNSLETTGGNGSILNTGGALNTAAVAVYGGATVSSLGTTLLGGDASAGGKAGFTSLGGAAPVGGKTSTAGTTNSGAGAGIGGSIGAGGTFALGGASANGGQTGNGSTTSLGGATSSGGNSVGAGGTTTMGGASHVVPCGRAAGFADDTYAPTSSWLRDAQPNIDYITNCARFWFKARAQEGGYYTDISTDGTPIALNGVTTRAAMTQSRDAYGFVRAFMVSGDETFLEHAEHALSYHYTLWLGTDGGWDSSHDAFFEHYALVGPAAMCEATGDATHCDWWKKGEVVLDAHLWDADPINYGYYQYASSGWNYPYGKTFNSTMDAVTTHDFARWLSEPQARATRIRELGNNMLDHFMSYIGASANSFGFPEYFSTDWQPAGGSSQTGHVLKAAWCLSRLFLALGDEKWRSGSETALDEVATKVWDQRLDYRFLSAGDLPEWWELEEAYNASMLGYYTGRTTELRARNLRLADESVDAFHRVYDDLINGETFQLPGHSGAKGSVYKAGYHTTETGYFSLLYGQLLYAHRPVSLYYRFKSQASARTVRLSPVEFASLRIASVTLNGTAYESFDSVARTIDIAADVGGIFKVTFWLDDATTVVNGTSCTPLATSTGGAGTDGGATSTGGGPHPGGFVGSGGST